MLTSPPSVIIDTHAHYDHKKFSQDRDKLIKSLPANGIETIINVGCDMPTSKASVKLADTYAHVYATVGVHPHEAKTLSDEALQTLGDLCANPKVLAYGEIGLDFFHNFSPQDVQHLWFDRQMKLAYELQLPVVIHSRDAHWDTFSVVRNSPNRRGVIHSFSGDKELALSYTDLGYFIGISGVITFDKAYQLQEAVAAIPLDKILLETDCPYLAPVPNRGKRNDSINLTYVATAIAKIKNLTPEEICKKTTENAKQLFGF